MTTIRYRLDIPEAKRFSWLYGIDKDLMIAEEMVTNCARAENEAVPDHDNLEEAYWTAAVIRYGRCFGSGSRHWQPELAIEMLSPELQQDHHYFKLMRDKMFAHSLGLGEDYTPLAFHTEFDGFSKIVNVGTGATRVSSLGTDLAERFLALIQALRLTVLGMLEQERLSLLAYVRTMPLEEVKAMGEWSASLQLTQADTAIRFKMKRRSRRTDPR